MKLAIVLSALLIASAALAHDWYPFACCGNNDCKPVPCDQLVEEKDGWLYLPTRSHFTQYQVQPSQDRFCHVCLGVTDGRSLCAFILSGV